MSRILIVGAGVSGLSIARLLEKNNDIVIMESSHRAGGIICCDTINGNLFHRTGGHVFNTKRTDVLNWFWEQFDKEKEFTKALRNSSVSMENSQMVDYPIENHVYQLSEDIQQSFYKDLDLIEKNKDKKISNFEEFLRTRFGETLYDLYFKPYNYKVWRCNLSTIPISWLEGKLPMPTVEEMRRNNEQKIKEQNFVHSSFYYPQNGGSQFIANRLSESLNIIYNAKAENLKYKGGKWYLNESEFDKVIFCGNIKQLPTLLEGNILPQSYSNAIDSLESHGTTAVFCNINPNPYSWIYMPSLKHEAHRIICTGNFSPNNNFIGEMTGTIEFTDYISKEDILNNLKNIPFSPSYIAHHYEKHTYPIQNENTREMVNSLKKNLESYNLHLLGRFAEWEYYNMDVAMGAAIDLSKKML